MSEQDGRRAPDTANLPHQPTWAVSDYAELRTLLGRMSTFYSQGAYQDVVEAIRIFKQGGDQTSDSQDTRRARLLASAHALEARALFQLERDDDARQAGKAAIELIEQVRTAPASQPASGDERNDLAIARYLAGGADPRARDELQERITAGAATAEMYRFLGLTLLRLEVLGPAETALRESRSLEPSSVRTLQALAHCLEAQPARQSDAAEIFYDLAREHYLGRRLPDAAIACLKCVQLAPTTERLVNFGIILAALSRYDEALAVFDHALTLEPGDSDARFRKGELLRIMGRHREAVTILEGIPESSQQHLFALGSLGAALRALGEHDKALPVLDQALAMRSDYAFALVERGEVLIALGRDDEAMASLTQVSEADQMFPRAQFQIAEQHRLRKRYDEAVRVADGILARDPGFTRVMGTKASALLGLGKPEEAIQNIDRALAIEPDYLFGLSTKGDALARLGRLPDAAAVYTRILELDPSSTQTRFDLAEVLRRLGRFDEALAAIELVLAKSPDFAVGVGTKGQILAGLDRRDEAVAVLRRSLELNPSLNWARSSLANTLLAMRRFDEALAEFNGFLEREPRDVRTLGLKGDLLLRLRRHDEALAALDLALGVDENDTYAIATKGEVLCDQGLRTEGVELLGKAIALETQQAKAAGRPVALEWAQFLLAENLRVLDRNAEALEAYDHLLERGPDRHEVLGGKASVLLTIERYDEAIAAVWRAVEISPDYTFGLSTQGALLANCGEYERALEPLTRATAGADATAYAFLLKGFACRVLGRWPDGIAALARAVEIDPSSLTARHLLADVYQSSGETAKAREMYQAILAQAADQSDPDTVAIVGWCCFRLGDHDRAVQLLLDAVARGRGMAHAQFDVALSLLCSHREGLAAREYERGIEMAATEHHPWRRRGLYKLALADLANAYREFAEQLTNNRAAQEIESHLRGELDRLPAVVIPTAAGATASR